MYNCCSIEIQEVFQLHFKSEKNPIEKDWTKNLAFHVIASNYYAQCVKITKNLSFQFLRKKKYFPKTWKYLGKK